MNMKILHSSLKNLQKLQEAKKEEYRRVLIAHIDLSHLSFKGTDKYKQQPQISHMWKMEMGMNIE